MIVASIAAAQAGLVVTIVLWSLRLPQTTRSGVIVLLALIIWAEAIWVLWGIASRVDRRLAEDAPCDERNGPARPQARRSPEQARSPRHDDRPLHEIRSRHDDRPRH